jgi:hypothetical protein
VTDPLNMNKEYLKRQESLPSLKSTHCRIQVTLKTCNQVIPPNRTQIVFMLVVETNSPKGAACRRHADTAAGCWVRVAQECLPIWRESVGLLRVLDREVVAGV